MKKVPSVTKITEKVKKTVTLKKSKTMPSYKEVKMGDKGEMIVFLQDLLNKDGSKVKLSGVFNIGTLSAVKAFQKRHKLAVTGVVDKKTWSALTKLK